MAITGTHHGLSVLTNAAAEERLQWPFKDSAGAPAIFSLSNTFNDATSGAVYAHASGHEGIDFACNVDTPVYAMYGGVVIAVIDEYGPTTGAPYGNFVTIQSHTNPANNAGFEHTYAHLSTVAVACGDMVDKGDTIGQSGNTGRVPAHLHVHLQPFSAGGEVPYPREDSPAGTTDYEPVTTVATRISGCMNFACFLPADGILPAITAAGQLLSARDANARIPVYADPGGSLLGPNVIDGSKLGCYAVTNKETVDDSIWYQIQFADPGPDPVVDPGLGWVSQMGTVRTDDVDYHVQWVQVEDAPVAPQVGRKVVTAASTEAAGIRVRSTPSTANLDNYRGDLTRNVVRYAIVGSFLDPDFEAGKAERCWWQIDLEPGIARIAAWTGSIPDSGWVRNDVVTEHGDLSRVPGAWPPAPTLTAAPHGATVRLTWTAPAWPDGTPQHLRDQITGYRIWRDEDPSVLSTGGETVIFNPAIADVAVPAASPVTYAWTDPTAAAVTVPHALLYYRVAARLGATAGVPSRYRSATPGVTTTNPDPNPGTSRAEEVWSELATVALPSRPQGPAPGAQVALRRTARATAEAILLPSRDAALADILAEVHLPPSGSSASGSAQTRAAAQSAERVGWVPMSVLTGTSDWAPRVRALPQPPFVRVTAPGVVPVRPGPDLGYTAYVAQIERSGGWYALIGKNGRWWQVRVAAATVGWLRAQDVETTHRDTLTAVPFVDESPAPEPAGPGGTRPGGHAVTRDSGHYLNLANSWGGAWAVSKAGREVTAAFQSTRSPVQWYARQNPRDLAVLPVAFRPTVTQNIRGAGVHVTEGGVDYAGSPPASFTLRVSTTGQVRYVDGAELDHVGFLRYEIGTADSGVSVTWRTATAVEEPVDPTPPGDLSASGTYHNRQDNWGSRWALARERDAVSGTFTTTRSAAEYYANDENPEALLWLPGEYWPDQDARFRVTGAVRVNKDGTDSPDTRLVNFWITVQRSDGRMYYDPDTALEAAGVGYVRYTVDVDWTAVARLTVPSAPQALDTDDVAAEEVELGLGPAR